MYWFGFISTKEMLTLSPLQKVVIVVLHFPSLSSCIDSIAASDFFIFLDPIGWQWFSRTPSFVDGWKKGLSWQTSLTIPTNSLQNLN